MVPIISAIIGFVIGWIRGGRNDGGTLDRLQFGAAHAIALGLLGLVLSVIYLRLSM